MKKQFFKGIASAAALAFLATASNPSLSFLNRAETYVQAAIQEQELQAGTWFESVYAQWNGAQTEKFFATLNGNPVDAPLVRYLGNDTWRVDVPGLAGGSENTLRIYNEGNELVHEADGLIVEAFTRNGFAFYENPVALYDGSTHHFPHGTTGGHNPDGTVAADTEIWYITHENRDKLALLSNRTEPLVVRILGRVGDASTGNIADLPANLTFQYMLLIENSQNITIEGVGPDAVIEGWGLAPAMSHNIIIRNLTFEHARHDGIWLRGPSTHGWITHNTFLISGDGASDLASGANNFTISYNQYIGTLQTMLANGNPTEPDFRGTWHGNWFFHVAARTPLLRAGQGHIFNNFFDNAGQGPDTRERAATIIEGNYFYRVHNVYHRTELPGNVMTASMENPPTLEQLLDAERNSALSGEYRVFGNTDEERLALVEGLVSNTYVQTTGHAIRDFRSDFNNRNIGNIGGGNNVTNQWEHFRNYFNPFNPHLLTPGIDVLESSQVPEHVRANSGTLRGIGANPAPYYFDPIYHLETPLISQMHINANRTFFIRTGRSPWATGYRFEWDQGTNGQEWSVIPNSPTVANAYQFTTPASVTASQGGTYQFRVTAINNRRPVGEQEATSETFTIQHFYVDETATPIDRAPLNNVLFSENFDGDEWNLGPIRDGRQLDQLGIGVRRFQYMFNNVIGLDPARLAAGVTHVQDEAGNFLLNPLHPRLANAYLPDIRRNDALIVNDSNAREAATFNGNSPTPNLGIINAIEDVSFDGNALLLRDWNWNNQADQERYATFMHIALPDEAIVTEGVVSISYDFLLNRSVSAIGSQIHPIQLYDVNGNVIMRRTSNGAPAINGETNPGLSLIHDSDTNRWVHIEVVLDFDAREFDIYLDGILYEYNVPIADHIQGLAYLVANTPTGNHANQTMNLAIDNIEVRGIGGEKIVEVGLTPETAEVTAGNQLQFKASALGNDATTAEAFEWFIEGQLSANTTISESGLLFVAEDEAAKTLIVRAGLASDPSIYAYAVVTILPLLEDEPTYPDWSAALTFGSGDRVFYEGRLFEAKWWTQNQSPLQGPWGAWMEIGQLVQVGDDLAVPEWTASRVFDAGDMAYYNGEIFRANWWTRNQSPTILGGPWEPIE